MDPRALDEAALTAWGRRIGGEVSPPLWIALYGPLGAGKSVLARAVCRGAGVTGYLPSPTFTLVQRYSSPRGFEVDHADLFRLQPGDPLEPLGWEELVGSAGLVLVEWADRAGDQQPADRWEVRLRYGETEGERIVEVTRLGDAPAVVAW